MRLLNLPIDVSYELVDVFDAGEVSTACYNCSMPIRNIATIKSSKGSYSVGLDCASTLCTQAGNQWQLEQQIKTVKREIARVSKAKRLIKQGGTATKFGKDVVVCYRKPNDGWVHTFEVKPMFTTAKTQLLKQYSDSLSGLPQLTCLADASNYATTLSE